MPNLINKLFSKEDLLNEAIGLTNSMLEDVVEMALAAWKEVRTGVTSELDIDMQDKMINRKLSEVRRAVIAHLNVGDRQNLYPALVLTSIVVDIERVGDYAKSMSSMARQTKTPIATGQFEEDLAKIEQTVFHELLPKGCKALLTEDYESAAMLLRGADWINRSCDEMAREMSTGQVQDMPASQQVQLVLFIRYIKRINSHWQNALTSIVNPYDRIGFYNRGK